ncbi:MAG: adenylyltransferase/cytidyltransferase family protein [Rhodocyclaceae bacterium]|nr:adenylyltransferase/cytidyltransferase family protein [Rhodocyclaceae bacterium]
MNNSKIISLQDLSPELIMSMKSRVLVGGCFDIFHFGHLDFLKNRRSLARRSSLPLSQMSLFANSNITNHFTTYKRGRRYLLSWNAWT